MEFWCVVQPCGKNKYVSIKMSNKLVNGQEFDVRVELNESDLDRLLNDLQHAKSRMTEERAKEDIKL